MKLLPLSHASIRYGECESGALVSLLYFASRSATCMPQLRVDTFLGQANTYRGGLSSDTVIDLTSSDTEDASASCPVTEAQPSLAPPFLNSADLDITSDGLLLEGNFGPLSQVSLK